LVFLCSSWSSSSVCCSAASSVGQEESNQSRRSTRSSRSRPRVSAVAVEQSTRRRAATTRRRTWTRPSMIPLASTAAIRTTVTLLSRLESLPATPRSSKLHMQGPTWWGGGCGGRDPPSTSMTKMFEKSKLNNLRTVNAMLPFIWGT